MKLDVAVNEVTLSNAGAVGEFRIRNSAKAFKILSDGLYSNKIRAVIRELSTNALDSHVAARKKTVPFEVHLPTQLEPWFSVKDFGLGLSGDEVMSIYSTYFESTKTDSNKFIGALGLGSKSPFSYTENFTVIAIKDGMKRIYSAFINDQGVPSVAEMSQELTDEVNGVEVKFSVTDRSDFYSFRNEAREVFRWFKNKPKITGTDKLEYQDVDYKEKNIVPGVHLLNNGLYGRGKSFAIMGNIPYPLDNIPEPVKNLGSVANLLNCGLVLEFEIGEVDFAASREQLSYIPLTMNSIKAKLDALNANLASHLAAKADAFTNEWERAIYLRSECRSQLYGEAVKKYIQDTKFPLFDVNQHEGQYEFKYAVSDLDARKLKIRAFRSNNGNGSQRLDPYDSHVSTPGFTGYVKTWRFPVQEKIVFVLNDLKTGCLARARYHFGKQTDRRTVYCISHEDVNPAVRQVEYDKLMAELHNPPTIVLASTLDKAPYNPGVKGSGLAYIRLKAEEPAGFPESYTWDALPTTSSMEADDEVYYVALRNRTPVSLDGKTELNVFRLKAAMDASGLTNLASIRIIGVRQSKLKKVQELDNWIWYEDKIKEEVAKIDDNHIASLVASEVLDHYDTRVYTNKNVAKLVGPDSLYAKYVDKVSKIPRVHGSPQHLVKFCQEYGKTVQIEDVKKKLIEERDLIFATYPMIKYVAHHDDKKIEADVVRYIRMIDKISHKQEK